MVGPYKQLLKPAPEKFWSQATEHSITGCGNALQSQIKACRGGGGLGTSDMKPHRQPSPSLHIRVGGKGVHSTCCCLSHAGLRCQARSERAWAGCRGTVGATAGKVYYEVTVADEGLCRVGWATKAGSLDVGTDQHSFGYGGTGTTQALDSGHHQAPKCLYWYCISHHRQLCQNCQSPMPSTVHAPWYATVEQCTSGVC